MQTNSYKYYSGITSQIFFCSTPLRLDPYSRCQFSCGYCFASTRQGHGRDSQLKLGNPKSLEERLSRVQEGNINSALDEFLQNRIPIQLGGMSDPFTNKEKTSGITYKYIEILNKYNYPFIISTKSSLVSEYKYLQLLKNSNAYVRFSTTVIDPILKSKIDKGCPNYIDILVAAKKLIDLDIPVSFRLQPIIPGFEDFSSQIISDAISIGVKHISAEFLKVPIDANRKFSKELSEILDGKPIAMYRELGAKKLGREYVLPLVYRTNFLIDAAIQTRANSLTFGFADNDLLLHSDGDSCCGASNLYLKNASFFLANIVGLAKNKKINEKLFFNDYFHRWIPSHSISTYLNSKARIITTDNNVQNWTNYLSEAWQGNYGIYSPNYFDGISQLSELDNEGRKIYRRTRSTFEKDYYSSFKKRHGCPKVA